LRLPARIFDAHFHLYRAAEVPAEGLMSAPWLRRDFGWNDYRQAWEGLDVEGAAFVQVRPEEDGLAEAIAISGQGPQGIVAGCVLEDPEQRGQLDRLARLPLVRGVRRGTQFHPDPLYLAHPEMIDGYRRAAELGLLGQVCVKHFQLEAVHRLASALPELMVILDHLGKPPLSEPAPAPWAEWMGRLSSLPNVYVKVAPSPQSAESPPLDRACAASVVAEVVALFGYDRCLYGSNWPVSTLLCGYREWVELVCAALPAASAAELDALFFRTGAGLFRSPAPAP
jgi:predicted TIM-barrel fold metal-dependent hydrolase